MRCSAPVVGGGQPVCLMLAAVRYLVSFPKGVCVCIRQPTVNNKQLDSTGGLDQPQQGTQWGGSEGQELVRGAEQQRGYASTGGIHECAIPEGCESREQEGLCGGAFTSDLLSLLAKGEKGIWLSVLVSYPVTLGMLKAAPWL